MQRIIDQLQEACTQIELMRDMIAQGNIHAAFYHQKYDKLATTVAEVYYKLNEYSQAILSVNAELRMGGVTVGKD